MNRTLFGKILRAGMRRLFRTLWIGGGLMAALGSVLVVFGDSSSSTIVATTAGMGACAAPSLVLFSAYRRLARLPQVPWSYRITSDEVAEFTPMVESSRPWSAVRAVTSTREIWVLHMTPAGVIGLPKVAFTSDQEAEFRAFLADQHLLVA